MEGCVVGKGYVNLKVRPALSAEYRQRVCLLMGGSVIPVVMIYLTAIAGIYPYSGMERRQF